MKRKRPAVVYIAQTIDLLMAGLWGWALYLLLQHSITDRPVYKNETDLLILMCFVLLTALLSGLSFAAYAGLAMRKPFGFWLTVIMHIPLITLFSSGNDLAVISFADSDTKFIDSISGLMICLPLLTNLCLVEYYLFKSKSVRRFFARSRGS